MNLFDPAPYTRGTPREERARTVKRTSEVRQIELGCDDWLILTIRGKPSAHIYAQPYLTEGSVEACCGVVGIPLTFDPGAKAGACEKCITQSHRRRLRERRRA